MFFCYDENSKFKGTFIPSNFDPNLQLYKHLENYFYLKFILNKSDRPLEKIQASKELEICERKMTFWKRQSDYCEDTFMSDQDKIRKIWSEK